MNRRSLPVQTGFLDSTFANVTKTTLTRALNTNLDGVLTKYQSQSSLGPAGRGMQHAMIMSMIRLPVRSHAIAPMAALLARSAPPRIGMDMVQVGKDG